MKREIVFNEIYDAQKYYRLLLDSMARPGKINTLPAIDIAPPVGLNKSSALVAFSLLNADVTFYCSNENSEAVSQYILLNTSASPGDVEDVNFIFLNGKGGGDLVLRAKVGTLSYPEEGATCVVDVDVISYAAHANAIKILLKGPGVENQNSIYVSGLSEDILIEFSNQNKEFPLGLDLIIADRNNNIFCIPRSNRLTWEV